MVQMQPDFAKEKALIKAKDKNGQAVKALLDLEKVKLHGGKHLCFILRKARLPAPRHLVSLPAIPMSILIYLH